MLKRIRFRLPGRGNGPWILVSAIGAALLVTPFAVAAGEGRPLDGGARNPSNNQSQAYNRETEIIANTSSYGTRQSNKSGNGGGAVYGCRSGAGGTPRNNEPCVRANNLSQGLAFEFAFEGAVGGTIDSRVPGATRKPFTTNATGVATGLNADQVDGKSATEIVNDAQAQNKFATVTSTGGLSGGRGATAAARTAGGTYSVVFTSDISGCALNVTVNATGTAGTAGATASGNTVTVVTRAIVDAGAETAGDPADRPFHLTVVC
jgi:hypothetical protein